MIQSIAGNIFLPKIPYVHNTLTNFRQILILIYFFYSDHFLKLFNLSYPHFNPNMHFSQTECILRQVPKIKHTDDELRRDWQRLLMTIYPVASEEETRRWPGKNTNKYDHFLK